MVKIYTRRHCLQRIRNSLLLHAENRHCDELRPLGKNENAGLYFRQVFRSGCSFLLYFMLEIDLKEVFLSLNYISTREKPMLRKLLDFAYIQNIFAMVATFPIFYYF
jgi:hypothetical protein